MNKVYSYLVSYFFFVLSQTYIQTVSAFSTHIVPYLPHFLDCPPQFNWKTYRDRIELLSNL